MKLDDLKQNWQKNLAQCHSQDNLGEVIAMLEQETKKIDKEVKRRDVLEISIAVLLIPVWIYGLFISASWMMTMGLIVALGTSVLIPYRMIKAKRIFGVKSDSVKAYLETERQKIHQQKQLLESIVWWYIAPITVSIVLITLGATLDANGLPQINQTLTIYYGFLVLLIVGIYFLNKRAAKRKFGPLLEKIEQRLAQMQS